MVCEGLAISNVAGQAGREANQNGPPMATARPVQRRRSSVTIAAPCTRKRRRRGSMTNGIYKDAAKPRPCQYYGAIRSRAYIHDPERFEVVQEYASSSRQPRPEIGGRTQAQLGETQACFGTAATGLGTNAMTKNGATQAGRQNPRQWWWCGGRQVEPRKVVAVGRQVAGTKTRNGRTVQCGTKGGRGRQASKLLVAQNPGGSR